MQIKQTYLGTKGNRGLFVYYLFRDYECDCRWLTKKVKDALDDLGADYRRDVNIFRPHERFAGGVADDIRGMQWIYECYGQKLPGLLVAKKPLDKIDPKDDNVTFYSIRECSEDEALQAVKLVRIAVEKKIYQQSSKRRIDKKDFNFFDALIDALVITPTIFGIGIDIKRFLRNIWACLRMKRSR